MAFPNPSIGDIVATTIELRSGAAADNVSRNNALLNRLKKRGNNRAYVPVPGGRTIWQEIEYAQNDTAMWYAGYEQLNIQPQQIFTAAEFHIRQAAVAVTFSGLEELQNASEEAIIDLVGGRVANAERTLTDLIGVGIYSDGTTAKQIGGTRFLIGTTPGSGTIGGISASTWEFWRNIAYSAATDGGAAATSANINRYMDAVWAQLVRGNDRPDLIVADNNYWMLYKQSLQPIQQITSAEMAEAGFMSLKYMGSDVVMDGGFQGYSGDAMGTGGQASNRMDFINTRYFHYRPHRDRNFRAIGSDRFSVNQDATTRLIGWAGNMTISNRRMHGVLAA